MERYTMPSQLIDIHRPVTVCKSSAGTGKTYTLAAYYVGLLLSGEDYRSILAITFTNKATSEMSDRILKYLHGISRGEEEAFLQRARQFMIRNEGATDEQLAQIAGACFKRMLLDFDNVQIMTIDSFLQTLLSGLAGVLRMSMGLNTELDIDHVIRQSVDQLLTTDMSALDRTILEDYMRIRLDQEAQWDVRQSLCAMAKEMYNESVQVLDANERILFDAAAIAARRDRIAQLWEEDEDRRALAQVLKSCDPAGYNRNTLAAYDRLVRSLERPEKVSAKDRFRGVTEKSSNDAQMTHASEIATRVARRYNTLSLTTKFSADMQLMSSLQALIKRNLDEANSALLARTAGTLSKALREGDADFILEKAGIRFKHVLMDEFQDTSQLQWSVISRLLADVLAGEGHTLLIVGDIKQSIYRWRNGDWHIMDGLTKEGGTELTRGRINERFESLTKNFRSSEQVVQFNLSLFDHLIKHEGISERIYGEGYDSAQLSRFYQSNKKRGGYVRFRAMPNMKKPDLAYDMFEQMERMLRLGVLPEQMMVLVRDKNEAALITDLHAAMDRESFPLLSQTRMVSATSYLLESSADVRMVIAGLRTIVQDDGVAERYITMRRSEQALQQIRERVTRKTPLYEAMSEIVHVLLSDENGQYTGSETAYVLNLLDRTRAYVSAYGSDMEDFLSFWDDTLRSQSIPASASHAIQILTVHKSKGLQSQTLFVPFCMWPQEAGKHPQKVWCEVPETIDDGHDYVPVQDGAEMALSEYDEEYAQEHANMRVDNLNMLYVALTRAEDNLFISTAYSITAKGERGACNHVGRYLLDYIGADEWEAGEAVVREPDNEQSTQTITAQLWSNSAQVRFVQSQEGALYTQYGEEAYEQVARMDEGVLGHEIFAHIRHVDDLDDVLDMFRSSGQISSDEQQQELKRLIASAWEGNAMMRDWFTSPWELKLEQPIYVRTKEVRPDRVMINARTGEAIVLDYKFGARAAKHRRQVRDYMAAMRGLGHTRVRGFLWYAQEKQLVEV